MLNKPHHDCFACCFYCKEASTATGACATLSSLQLKQQAKMCDTRSLHKVVALIGGLSEKVKVTENNTLNFPRTLDNSELFWHYPQSISCGYDYFLYRNIGIEMKPGILSALFTVVALRPVTWKTNGTGSQLTTVNIKVIIHKRLF